MPAAADRGRLTAPEAAAAVALLDAWAAPEVGLASDEAASAAFVRRLERLLRASPAPSRLGVRALLLALEFVPDVRSPRRFSTLPGPQRSRRANAWRRRLAAPMRALGALLLLAYYDDGAVAGSVGYDRGRAVGRARAVRAGGGRW